MNASGHMQSFLFLQFSRCRVIGKQEKGLDVLLLPSKKKAFLPKQHLSDSLEMCNALLKFYKEKDVIEEVMYFNKSHIVVSFMRLLTCNHLKNLRIVIPHLFHCINI